MPTVNPFNHSSISPAGFDPDQASAHAQVWLLLEASQFHGFLIWIKTSGRKWVYKLLPLMSSGGVANAVVRVT
jgi:hypothetical protein